MDDYLRILMLEDVASDVDLIEDELQTAGLHFVSRIVSTRHDFLDGLEHFSPDVILSDYNLPQYDGMKALKDVRQRYPDIPFILVSGSVRENIVADMFIHGANDCVMKNHLQRLVPAVCRSLDAAGTMKS
jgi:CheY-like chemotaxis protein